MQQIVGAGARCVGLGLALWGAACGSVEDSQTGQPIDPGGKADHLGADAALPATLTLQQAALAISDRCMTVGCFEQGRLDENEMQIVFAAAAEQEGISLRMLKAIAYGEAIATAYTDKWPRHYIDVEFAPGLANQANWMRWLLHVDIPLMFGDDRQFGSQTYGLGVAQTTADIAELKIAILEHEKAEQGEIECGALRYSWQADWKGPALTCMALVHGGGIPGSWYPEEVRMDVHRVIYDPFYELQVAARLIRHKINNYSHPDRPKGPISWVSPDPDAEEDPDYAWALIGSTYQTYGGYGPGGGATTRIYNRMTGIDEEAWPFVSGGYVLPPP